MSRQVKNSLQKLANPKRARLSAGYFKTGKGEYAEGDKFIGLTVPSQREIARKYYQDINLVHLQNLLNSKIHEYRLTAIMMLTLKYEKAKKIDKKIFVELYLKNTRNINNWDLIDLSSNKIVGNYLLDKPKDILYKLAKSKSIWEKRIAMLATFEFIKNKKYDDALKIGTILLHDSHDLIQKAVGWMLREVGKKDLQIELKFLDKHYKTMPRTTLRYAIEKFTPTQRNHYLGKNS